MKFILSPLIVCRQQLSPKTIGYDQCPKQCGHLFYIFMLNMYRYFHICILYFHCLLFTDSSFLHSTIQILHLYFFAEWSIGNLCGPPSFYKHIDFIKDIFQYQSNYFYFVIKQRGHTLLLFIKSNIQSRENPREAGRDHACKPASGESHLLRTKLYAIAIPQSRVQRQVNSFIYRTIGCKICLKGYTAEQTWILREQACQCSAYELEFFDWAHNLRARWVIFSQMPKLLTKAAGVGAKYLG